MCMVHSFFTLLSEVKFYFRVHNMLQSVNVVKKMVLTIHLTSVFRRHCDSSIFLSEHNLFVTDNMP